MYYFYLGKEFSDAFYFKHKKFFHFFKYFVISVLTSVLLGLILKFSFASALSTSTDSDVLQNSSYVANLLSLIPDDNYSDDYVIFSDSDYSYYCFYGKFSVNNNIITGENLNFIHYSRNPNSYSWSYSFGTDNLSLTVEDIICSNLNIQMASNSWSYDNFSNTKITTICCLAFIPILLFSNLWGCIRHDFV